MLTAPKILIIDDDEGVAFAIGMVLEDRGFQVEIITQGDQAETAIDQVQPDLILLDILLSGLDGRQICQSLKQKTSTKSIPVIMISAHPNASEFAREAGSDDFLAKPFNANDLVTKINALIPANTSSSA